MVLYIFLDEAGNFDFSPHGTKYFVISALSRVRPCGEAPFLIETKYDHWEAGLELECFHASEDKQVVRDSVFRAIDRHCASARVDAQIVEKAKTNPSLREHHARFYYRILNILLHFVLDQHAGNVERVIILSDQIPVKHKKKDLEKAIKLSVADWSKREGIPYMLMFHSSRSDTNLQVVDYLNWSIYRKWERGDERSYSLVRGLISSEYETFKAGTIRYY